MTILSRRRAAEEEEHEGNHERWMLTYADMITLLLALFIIMYGMSAADSAKVQSLSEGFEEALNPEKAAEDKKKAEASAEGNGTGTGTGSGAEVGAEANADEKLSQIVKELKQYISENDLKSQIALSISDAGVSIQLKDSLLFHPNTADLLNKNSPVLKEIANIIQSIYSTIDHISIVGNTADLGNRDQANLIDSYDLSSKRAVAVLSILLANGVKPDKLVVEGHSHYSPVSTNKTHEGRSKNRRVDIMIYKDSINVLASKAKANEKTSSKASE